VQISIKRMDAIVKPLFQLIWKSVICVTAMATFL
jgi:hypothetical protein